MKVEPWIIIYNGGSTGPCIYRCMEYLLGKRPRSFGTAVAEVELYAHCHTRARTEPGLGGMRKEFDARLATFPYVRFARARRQLVVHFASNFIHRDSLFGASDLDLPTNDFALLCREFAAALLLIRTRLKKSDAFDVVGLEEHLQRRLAPLPAESPVKGITQGRTARRSR
jgi:hypothetical protein